MTHVGLVSGFWGQNIGNAFFNLGGRATLEAAGAAVSFIQDHPAYWTFRDESKGSYERRWPIIEHLDVDLVVLQGPLLTRNFANIWLDTLKSLEAKGIGYALLSAAFRSYTQEELSVARNVFEQVRPQFVSTRDEQTYKALQSAVPASRAGIDSAFFLPQAYDAPRISTPEPFITVCYDHFLEPDFVLAPDGLFRLDGSTFSLRHPPRLERLSRRSKAHAYLAHAMDRRTPATSVGPYTIVRPEHRTNPHLPAKIYRRPNAIASDEPWTYLAAYANTSATVSDRVHACVATLAYGGQATLHNPTTKRSALFDAVGAGHISKRFVRLSSDRLATEFDATTQALTPWL